MPDNTTPAKTEYRSALAPTHIQPMNKAGKRFWLAVGLLAIVFSMGVAGFIWRWQSGWDDRPAWGYYAATFSFLLSTAQTAPLISAGLRLVAGPWRRPLARPAELFAFVGILNILWFIPLLKVVPDTQHRRSIWFDSPISFQIWETIALAVLISCGLCLLYMASMPDIAAKVGKAPGKQGFPVPLGLSWRGNPHQWRILKLGLVVLGAGYIIFLIFQQTIFASDFGLSLVPGWKDALFPAYHIVSSLQAGTALLTVSLFLLRQWGGLKDYIGLDTFKGLGRLLLVLTLLWFYFWWSSFIVLWYGRRPEEQLLLQLFVSGPIRPLFTLVLILNFVLPFLLLLWSPIRKSIAGPVIVSVFILSGTLLDRIRLFTTAFSVTESGEVIKTLPPTRVPDTADIFILMGGLAGMALTYLVATRLLPVLSYWEITQGKILESEKQIGLRKVKMVAKPE